MIIVERDSWSIIKFNTRDKALLKSEFQNKDEIGYDRSVYNVQGEVELSHVHTWEG